MIPENGIRQLQEQMIMEWKKIFFRSSEILIGGAILAGAVLFYMKTGSERKVSTMQRKTELPSIRTEPVKSEIIQTTVEGIGTGLAKESVDITANATELVVGLYFDDGQNVQKDQRLVQLRDDQYQAELQQTRINLAEQERELNRLTPLYHARITSQKDFDAAKTAVSRAKTAVSIVEYQIGNRRIIAPFSGRLGMRKISIGDLVSPGTKITTLDDISAIKVDFRVSEKYFPQIHPGQKVGVQTAAYPNRVFDGTITVVSPRIDDVTRTVEVRAVVPNPEERLTPGMLFVVKLELGSHSAITIPEQAVMSLGEIQYAFVYQPESRTVQRREIQLGQRSRGRVEVLSGLREKELLVTDGVLKLTDGGQVRDMTSAEPGKGVQP